MQQFITEMLVKGRMLKKLYDNSHIGAYAAKAAFFVLVSAVPLVMFIIAILGVIAPFDVIGLSSAAEQVFTDSANEYVLRFLSEVADHSTVPLASVTMLFLIWSATKGIRSIADGINVIYNYHEEYNIVQITLRSVLYTVVLLLVCLVSMAVMVFATPLEKFITEFLDGRFSWLLAVINMHNILLFTSLWLLFAFAYKSLAKNPLSFRNQLFGAAVAAAGWILYTFGYSVYIRYFSRYSTLYGAFGAVMLFMLWLYMCMNILLCGALINKIKNENLLCGGD